MQKKPHQVLQLDLFYSELIMQIYTECDALGALFLQGLQNHFFPHHKTLDLVIWRVFSQCFSFGP